MNLAILELYCGESGKLGYYNSQELGLARAFAHRGINVTIVYPNKGITEVESQEIEKQITILSVPCINIGVHAFYKLDFLIERRIETVHLDSDNQIYAPSVMKFCKKHGIFFYSYVGTIYSDTKNCLKKWMMDQVSQRNIKYFRKTSVIAKTQTVKGILESHGVSNVSVVPVGLDLSVIKETTKSRDKLCSELGIPKEKKILLFVGRLEQYKRPFAAIDLIERLGEAYHLVVIGTGSLREDFCMRIKEDALLERVSYFEKISNSEMYQYYCACDYYVNFNTHEIFGMSILEAMYQESVVVARRAPGPEEIIEDKVSGFLCDSDEDMACVIESEDTIQIGMHAKKRILSHFTWDRSAGQILENVKFGSGYV